MPPLIYRRILKLKANTGLQLSEWKAVAWCLSTVVLGAGHVPVNRSWRRTCWKERAFIWRKNNSQGVPMRIIMQRPFVTWAKPVFIFSPNNFFWLITVTGQSDGEAGGYPGSSKEYPLPLPSGFPRIRVFSNEAALHIRWSKYCSFSFSISSSNEYPGLMFVLTTYWYVTNYLRSCQFKTASTYYFTISRG